MEHIKSRITKIIESKNIKWGVQGVAQTETYTYKNVCWSQTQTQLQIWKIPDQKINVEKLRLGVNHCIFSAYWILCLLLRLCTAKRNTKLKLCAYTEVDISAYLNLNAASLNYQRCQQVITNRRQGQNGMKTKIKSVFMTHVKRENKYQTRGIFFGYY